MFTINSYVLAESLQQAYELCLAKGSTVLGGILWLKMGKRKFETAIDLSALGLNTIAEDENSFKLGSMCSLRDLERHPGLSEYFNGYIADAIEHIVGVQFRNGATVGGSVFSKLAFSDVLTALLALDTQVELFHGGLVKLSDFIQMPPAKDIMVNIVIKKDGRRAAFASQRLSATDFPILNCAVSNMNDNWKIVLGSRPQRAQLTEFTLGPNLSDKDIEDIQKTISETVSFGTNSRGSGAYRGLLAKAMIVRCIDELVLEKSV